MSDSVSLFITPEYDAIREDLGYDEYDDYDETDVLYQQGYHGEMVEIQDGETFEIPEQYCASIQCDDEFDEYYVLDEGDDADDKMDFLTESLSCGSYRFDAKNNIFWKTKTEDPFDL